MRIFPLVKPKTCYTADPWFQWLAKNCPEQLKEAQAGYSSSLIFTNWTSFLYKMKKIVVSNCLYSIIEVLQKINWRNETLLNKVNMNH